jgi:hypothetical protein
MKGDSALTATVTSSTGALLPADLLVSVVSDRKTRRRTELGALCLAAGSGGRRLDLPMSVRPVTGV